MNFMEAVKSMKEGKKVTREKWSGFPIYSDGDYFRSEDVVYPKLKLESFEATDWEIYEDDNWDLNDNPAVPVLGFEGKKDIFFREDIKTFIQKVKEDIDKLATDGKAHNLVELEQIVKIKEIIDKRAGKL